MSKIFLIPGMGADTRIYNNIDLLDNDVIPVNWIMPDINDTLTSYAQKLILQYHISNNSILIGNSLGGMIAIEIANMVPISKVILISSIKTINEAPWYFKLFRNIPVYKMLPNGLMNTGGVFIKPVFGNMKPDDLWLFKDMLKKSSPVFVKWAMGAVLKWNNQTIPPNVYHIIGDKDRVFNYKLIKDAIIIEGGTHIMVFDMAKQINKLLKTILKKK
jgi:pimeloyl-ACP methyl ester carboxylesterase